MQKTILYTSLIASSVLILDSMNAFNELAFFLIAGKIPGTTLYLDASTMLSLSVLMVGLIFGRLAAASIRRQRAQYSRPKAATLAG
ncbi:MAG TPA: hypothetical protein QF549_03555 [Candidatus Saccharimonadaceae bacterium]|nr:hypothetical protein [Candidatus Saccharimonadaceae bacterium]